MVRRFACRGNARKRFVKRRRFTGRRAGAIRRRIGMRKRMRGPGQFARTVESYSLDYTFGTSAQLPPITLADVPWADRTAAIAQYFREYRIKWVQVIFKAPYNMYQLNTSIVPNMYVTHDYENAFPATISEAEFKDMGAKPRPFKGMIKMTWKPRVRYAFQDDVNKINIAKQMVAPWLNTNQNAGDPTVPWDASEVNHYGLKWFITPITGPPFNATYQIDVRCCFEFRKPSVPTDEPPPAKLAVDEHPELGEETKVDEVG